MDFKTGDFCPLSGNSPQKLPFYMTYPMQNVFLEEAEYARDWDRLKGMYPEEIRRIQRHVEDECDRMEYEGSLMFDEYPDRVLLLQIVGRIYMKVANDGIDPDPQGSVDMESEEFRGRDRFFPGRPGFRPPIGERCFGRDCNVSNLIEVLLFNEMFNRRCRHRRCRRWW